MAAKNQHQPSAFVQNRDASVPHNSSGRSVRIRPLWLRSPRGRPRRTGTSSPCSRISLSTRFLPARIPLAASRAFTLRWPSPRNGLAFSTVRISPTSSSSLSAVFGPRFPGCRRSDSGRSPRRARSSYTLERATRHVSHTIVSGYGWFVAGLTRPSASRASSARPRTPFFREAPPATRPASSTPPASPGSASARLPAGSSS